MSDDARPAVSITIVLHRSAGHLDACLRSIAGPIASGDAELIAVDNASPDDSAAIVQRAQPEANLLRSPENLGFAGACGLAWPRVRGRYWLLLNPDVELDPGAIATLAHGLDATPAVAAVSPWLRDAEGGPLSYPGRRFPSPWPALAELTRAHRLLPQPRRGRVMLGSYVRPGDRLAPEPDWLPGAALMLRRAAVEQVGGLDPSYFLYGEDLDWCWRARRAGWRMAVADAGATHHEGTSARATMGGQEGQDRIAAGIASACVRNGGRLRAGAYGTLTAVALTLEAHHPGRSPDTRADAALAARAWRRALRRVPAGHDR